MANTDQTVLACFTPEQAYRLMFAVECFNGDDRAVMDEAYDILNVAVDGEPIEEGPVDG